MLVGGDVGRESALSVLAALSVRSILAGCKFEGPFEIGAWEDLHGAVLDGLRVHVDADDDGLAEVVFLPFDIGRAHVDVAELGPEARQVDIPSLRWIDDEEGVLVPADLGVPAGHLVEHGADARVPHRLPQRALQHAHDGGMAGKPESAYAHGIEFPEQPDRIFRFPEELVGRPSPVLLDAARFRDGPVQEPPERTHLFRREYAFDGHDAPLLQFVRRFLRIHDSASRVQGVTP